MTKLKEIAENIQLFLLPDSSLSDEQKAYAMGYAAVMLLRKPNATMVKALNRFYDYGDWKGGTFADSAIPALIDAILNETP